jgi:hypothetical protein
MHVSISGVTVSLAAQGHSVLNDSKIKFFGADRVLDKYVE